VSAREWHHVPPGKVLVVLTRAEAEALSTCAGEGYAGYSTDQEAARGYLGGPHGLAAATRALRKLHAAQRAALAPGEVAP
jgi:hypothetical protein